MTGPLSDDASSSIVQQMPGVSDEMLSELRPCPFCGGPVSFQGAAIRCNSFTCNASMSPRWTKAVVGSAKGDPDERLTLAKADCQRRWNIRAAVFFTIETERQDG
ncbi:hypothetical protein [Paracoccus yeei]|uniref:Restriction alleviation protein, Lar family n=1 Tax=Paracoccus yeei TaxID=147645 RepID=A0A2D2C0X8_9RHOB|nr:hypothetical protein [Paracoccus yeei]ATQ56171.1 hypothetical protein PYTT13_10375 [Paracoccus yeei]